jgi:hypothetical protein
MSITIHSVLQCLSHTEPLTAFFVDENYQHQVHPLATPPPRPLAHLP